jgi:hypothetical protein
MASQGDVIENPLTGVRITFQQTTGDELLPFEYVLPPVSPSPSTSTHARMSVTRPSRGPSVAGWKDGSRTLEKASMRSARELRAAKKAFSALLGVLAYVPHHSTSFQIPGCSSPSSPTSAKISTARLRCVMDSSRWPATCSRSARLLCNAASR